MPGKGLVRSSSVSLAQELTNCCAWPMMRMHATSEFMDKHGWSCDEGLRYCVSTQLGLEQGCPCSWRDSIDLKSRTTQYNRTGTNQSRFFACVLQVRMLRWRVPFVHKIQLSLPGLVPMVLAPCGKRHRACSNFRVRPRPLRETPHAHSFVELVRIGVIRWAVHIP